MTVYGVGIVGAGRVSRDHAFAVQTNSRLEFAGVADPEEHRRAAFSQRYGCPSFSDHRELFSRDDVDLVLLGAPHWLHATIGVEALKAGRHILIEKPMAMTLEECDALVETAENSDVRLMVGHTQHFFAANLTAQRSLRDSGACRTPTSGASRSR